MPSARTHLLRRLAAVAVFLVAVYLLAPIHRHHRQPVKFTKSSFDWGSLKPFHPVTSTASLPTGPPRKLPRIQHDFGNDPTGSGTIQTNRRDAVQKVFQRSWTSYRKYAWMRDELTPLTAGAKTTFGGWAATLVDSLDILWIMDLKSEFREAVQAVATLDWADTNSTSCNLFETTIRHLGGLLSAYDLSQEPVLLQKAVELGDMLYAGFDTPNRMPPMFLHFDQAKAGLLTADYATPAAAPASLSMEFTHLSQLTGNAKYYDAISTVTNLLQRYQNATKLPGMWPTMLNMYDANVTQDNSFTLGALSDSLYEYLPKMHILLGGLEPIYQQMHLTAASTIQNNLLFRPMTPGNADILFSGTTHVGKHTWLEPEGQHLACFMGGMFALSGRLFSEPSHNETGIRLTRGCVWAYKALPTGIMPEIFNMISCPTVEGCEWNETLWIQETKKGENWTTPLPKGFRNAQDPKYILRPEAIESVFLLYRITGLEEFREAAWDMFQAIEKATSTPYGNAAIDDVTMQGVPTQRDSMESFWLAETLKYFYLIFSPVDLMSLDDWVLNTEAHPFRIPKP